MPVDLYVGGAEHACMHLIYSRFYTMFLHDLGLVDFEEFAPRLFHQGMVNDEKGEKMSKSKGNVVEPMATMDEFGVDTTRFFVLSVASPDKGFNWSQAGISGSLRFINSVANSLDNLKLGKDSQEVLVKLNKSIKNISEQIEAIDYRKSTIELRELFELILTKKEISKESFGKALQLFSLFCPHIAEELWEKIGNKGFISNSTWPKYEEIKVDVNKNKVDLTVKTIETVKNVLDKLADKKIKKAYVYVMPFEIGSIDKEKLKKSFSIPLEIFATNDSSKYDPEDRSKKAKPGMASIFVE
jgi:leucyl-tRNA synthetase